MTATTELMNLASHTARNEEMSRESALRSLREVIATATNLLEAVTEGTGIPTMAGGSLWLVKDAAQAERHLHNYIDHQNYAHVLSMLADRIDSEGK